MTVDKKESVEVKEDKAKMTVNVSALGSELRLDRLLGLTKKWILTLGGF